MFSPKAFLHDIISRNLSEWVENIQEDSFHLGLLEGDIQLSNLAIKKKTWGLSQNLSLSLEYGSIEKFTAQVPWLQLHTGQVNVFVDTVILIFRINVLDHDKSGVQSGENFTHELKMDLLQKEELKLSSETEESLSKSSKKSWMTRSMSAMLNSFVSKIASNFNLTATNIKVSLLLPLPQNENAQLKLNVQSLVVNSDISSADRNRASSGGGGLFEFFLTKDVQIRGLSISLNRVVKPSTHRDFVNLSKNKSHDTVGVILNPCNTSTQVFGRKDRNSESYLQNLSTLSVHLNVSNMEWTPSCDQLFLLKDVLSHLEQEEVKFRYHTIRALLKKPSPSSSNSNSTENATLNGVAPSAQTPSNGHARAKSGSFSAHSQSQRTEREREKPPFNPREVWLFAIRAILVMVKERNSGGKFTPQLRSGMERLGLRRQYLALHRKVMDAKLHRVRGGAKSTSTKTDTTDGSSHMSGKTELQEVLENGLNSAETRKYAELHSLFSLSDLVLFRATVLQEYRNNGVSSADLRGALTNQHNSNFWSRWFDGGKTSTSSNHNGDVNGKSGTSQSTPDTSATEDSNVFTFELKGTLSRLSVTVYDNPLEPHHPNNRVQSSDANNLHYSTPASAMPARNNTSTTDNMNGYTNNSTIGTSKVNDSARRAARRNGRNLAVNSQLQSRVGQTVRGTPATSHTASAATAADALILPKQCFSLVLYGIHTAFEWAGDNDRVIVLSLGSLKCFGHKGTEIISVGGDPNYWLSYNFTDAQDAEMAPQSSVQETDTSKALSLSLKWCHTGAITSSEQAQLEDLAERERRRRYRRARRRTASQTTNDSASDHSESSGEEDEQDMVEEENEAEVQASLRKARTAYGLTLAADKYTTFDGDGGFGAQAMSSVYKNLMRASNKHLVVDVSLSYVHLTWHKKSALFISDLYFHLAPSASPGSSSTPFQSLKDQCALLSFYRAARGIVDVPAKVSIEASGRGLTIQVPIQGSNDQTASSLRRPSRGGAGLGAAFTAPRKPFMPGQSVGMDGQNSTKERKCKYVQLSVGKISLASGDYLTGYLTSPRAAPLSQPLSETDLTKNVDLDGARDLADSCEENDSNANLAEEDNMEFANVSRTPSTTPRSPRPTHRNSMYSNDGLNANSGDFDATSDEPVFVPLTPQEKIRELVLALRNGAVRPMAFSVANVELCIVSNAPAIAAAEVDLQPTKTSLHHFFLSVPVEEASSDGPINGIFADEGTNPKRMLTAAPWRVWGVLSPSVVPANSAFTRMRFDLICSSFQLLLSTEDIITLIDMGKGMAAVCAPVVADVTAGPVAPRIRRLSPLSCLFVDVEMEEVGIEFLVARQGSSMSTSGAIATALRVYGSLVQTRGRYSFVALSRRPVVLSQLCSLGVSKSEAFMALNRFESDVVESRHDVQYIADIHTMMLYGKSGDSPHEPATPIYVPSATNSTSQSPPPYGPGASGEGSPLSETCRAVLFNLQISGLRFLHHGLTYDQRNLVTLTSMILFDKERVPLVKLCKDLSERLEHFPHLSKDNVASSKSEEPGINVRSSGGNGGRSVGRRRESVSAPRRDSTSSVQPRSQEKDYSRDRRNSSRGRARRCSNTQDSPPDARRYSMCDNMDQLEGSDGVFVAPSYDESFRIDRYESTCALALRYEEKDLHKQFGEGGWDVDVLYKPLDADCYGVRDGFVTMNTRQVEIQFSTNSILQIIEQAVAAANVVRSHYVEETSAQESANEGRGRRNSAASRRRSTSAAFFESPSHGERDTRRRKSSFAQMAGSRDRSSLHASIGGRLSKVYVHQYQRRVSVKSDLGALMVVLSWEKHYLAQLSLYRARALVQDLTNLEGGRTLTGAIHSISLLDLSDMGALHSEVLWKYNDNLSMEAILESIKAAEKENNAAASNLSNSEYLYRESSRRVSELFKQEKARIDDAPPVIAFSLTQTDTIVKGQTHQKLLMNVELHSLRVNFLYRFLMEIVGYFKDKFVVPLKGILESMDERSRRLSLVPAPLKLAPQDSDISDASFDSAEDSISDSDSNDNYLSWSDESVSDDDEYPNIRASTRFNRRASSPNTSALPAVGGNHAQRGAEPEETKMEVVTHFDLVVTAIDLAGMVPRHSTSRDVIGLKINEVTCRIGLVANPFPLPEKDGVFPGLNPVESDAELPLHFDIATNAWRYRPSLATTRAKARVAAQSNLDALLRRTFSNPSISAGSRTRDRAMSSASGTGNSGIHSASATVISARSGVDEEKDPHNAAYLQGVGPEWSADYDQSSLKDWGDSTYTRSRPSMSGFNAGFAGATGAAGGGNESTWWLHDDEEERERLFCLEELAMNEMVDNFDPKDCLRIGISITGVRAFVTFAGPSSYHKEDTQGAPHPPPQQQSDPTHTPNRRRSYTEAPSYAGAGHGTHPMIDTTEHKIFSEIIDGGLVNHFRRKAGGTAGVWPANQTWREVTLQSFNLCIVIDITDDKVKLLFGDTADMSMLHVSASQSEFYLLLDLWFNNIYEDPQFGLDSLGNGSSETPASPSSAPLATPGASMERETHREKETVRFDVHSDADSGSPRNRDSAGNFMPITPPRQHAHQPPPHFSAYGSKEYLQFLRERFGTFEIVVVLAEVRLKASLDTNYFTRDLPNQVACAGMVPTDAGNAYIYHASAHHHHHSAGHRSHNGPGSGRTPKHSDDTEKATPGGIRGTRGTSSDDRMGHSFYNVPVEPHTPVFSKKAFVSRWVNKNMALADVHLTGAMLHVVTDHDVVQLSLGAGKAEVYDMRHPQRICTPLALRVAPSDDPTTMEHVQNNPVSTSPTRQTNKNSEGVVRRRVYGYSDLNFGFDLVPSSMCTAPDLPLKMSLLLSTTTNWNTLNIGADLLDLNINNLDLVNLVSDYFSCYFRFPEYGHPGVQSYDRLTAPHIIPYGGVDTRVFVFRPHIAMLKAAMNLQSPALLLETDGGIYFRYTLDTESTVKMDLNIFSLAVILVKRYRAPSQYRGIRGSSGSGKGVRTLIEFLNLGMSYHFLATANNLDVKLFVSGPENDDDDLSSNADANNANESTAANQSRLNPFENEELYVDLASERLKLGSSAIPHPHSVFPLVPSRTDFTPHSCDVVTSYEDLSFCVSLVNKFLNIKDKAKSRKEKKKEKKMRENMSTYERTRADSETPPAEPESEVSLVKPSAVFSVLSLAGLRLMVVDNVLGLHLPLVQIYLEEVQCTYVRDDHANMALTCSSLNDVMDRSSHVPHSMDSSSHHRPNTRRFSRERDNLMSRRYSEAYRRDSLTVELVRLKNIAQFQLGLSSTPSIYTTGGMLDAKAMAKQEIMTFGKFTLWAEYFNNMRKCWEPLLEKLVATVLYEKSLLRGTGLTVRTASAVHANISGAFFRTLNDILTTLRTHRGDNDAGDETEQADMHSGASPSGSTVGTGPSPRKAKRGSIHVPDMTDHDYQYDDHNQHELTQGQSTPASTGNRSLEKKKSDRLSLDRSGRPWSQRRKSRYSDSFHRRSSINKDMIDDASSQNSGSTAQRKLDHVPSNPLSANFRVGFSIQNLTGQPVRYLQQWEGGRRTVQYINNNERGLLNFVASKTLIRNNQVIEETFDVQMELSGEHYGARNRRKAVGNRVALQVSGYRWLHAVQADELGVHYEELYSVLGLVHASQLYKNWKVVNSLKLMVEVMPYAGGRMLRLRSVFTIKNNTRHRLKILAKEGKSASSMIGDNERDDEPDAPFLLESGENFYVPLALLRRSVLASGGKSLGYLYLCPADLSSIEEELLSRPNSQPGSVEYTTDPINLYQTVSKSTEMAEMDDHDARRMMDSELDFSVKPDRLLAKENYTQLVCHINPKLKSRYGNGRKSGAGDWQNNTDFQQQQDVRRTAARAALNKLPPFCYCVEVQSGTDFTNSQNKGANPSAGTNKNSFFSNVMNHNPKLNSPVNFTITIHPPIVLENLLPCSGIFELVHATQKRVLWSSFIAAGTAKPVHTVTLEEPLLLLINLKYCRSSEGALIHQPRRFESSEGIVGKMQRTLEGLLEDSTNLGGEGSEDITSIVLTDTVGQRIRVNVENTLGGGGQRQVAVYCPYWVVNTSQYSLRILEDGANVLPAGTVTAQKDGTRPVPHSGSAFAEMQARTAMESSDPQSNNNPGVPSTLAGPGGYLSPNAPHSDNFHNGPKKSGRTDSHVGGAVFPGCYGPLHSVNNREFAIDSPLGHQLQELSFNEVVDLSYMFNYIEPQGRLSKKRVKVQLDDTTWSRSFSLDSVGVDQMLTVNDHIRGCMEMGFKISVAPGRLAKYTKIVRFLPRFSVVNKLPISVKVLQPTGFAGEAAEVEVSAERVRPYHLPAMFGERLITLQLEGGWHRSVVFSIDQIGVFNMEIKRRVNLATIQHVNTRGAPEYVEVFPAMRTLGVYFETDWGEENIVVKSFQKNSFASTKTDIKVGDVLVSIDDEPVDGKQFELAMVLLRNKLAADGCRARFRTVEEKIRLIRESALTSTVRGHRSVRRRLQGAQSNTNSAGSSNSTQNHLSMHDMESNEDVSSTWQHEVYNHNRGHSSNPSTTGTGQNSPRFDMDNADIVTLEDKIQTSRHTLEAHSRERAREKDRIVLRVELRQVEASAMILVQELGPKVSAEYRIENKSVCYKLYYKQKGIVGNSWIMLNPGQSRSYVWEDPFKPHKLLVHSGDNVLSPSNNLAHITSEQAGAFLTKRNGEDMVSAYWGYLAGINADQATVVNLDEIGSKEALFVSKQTDLKMVATVKSEGPTKILLITPSLDNRHVIRELRYTSEFINHQLNLLNSLLDKLAMLAKSASVAQLTSKLSLLDSQFEDALVRMQENQNKLLEVDEALNSSTSTKNSIVPPGRNSFVGKRSSSPGGMEDVLEHKLPPVPATSIISYKLIERVMDAGIDRQHQLEISVLEAKELAALVAGKKEDVYCKVVIKSEDLSVMTQSRYNKAFRTYICDSTLDPNWLEQRFVFEVPEKAVSEQRKYMVKVFVKARSIVGLDTTLGQTDIEFSALKEERPLEGWFPLRAPRSTSVLSLKVSGSIKLRLQWVHSPVGFANYMMTALEERQQYLKLQYNVQRFSLKHLQKLESNKSLTAKNDKIQRMQLRQAEKDYYELFEALSDREKSTKSAAAPFQALLQQQSQKLSALGINMNGVAMDIESENTPGFPNALELRTSSADYHNEMDIKDDEEEEEEEKTEYESDHELGKHLQLDDFIANRGSNRSRAKAELNALSAKYERDMMSPVNATDLLSPMKGGTGAGALTGTASKHAKSASFINVDGSTSVVRSVLKDPSRTRSSRVNVNVTPVNSVGRTPKLRRGLSSKFDEEGNMQSLILKPMPNVVYSYDQTYHNWATNALNDIPVHQAMSVSMDRAQEVSVDHQAFCRRFDQECRRSFEHVHTLSGTLEVTPMQALHLPEAKNPMLVRVSYGDQRHSTFRLPPASYLTWYQEQDTGPGAAPAGLYNPDYAENGGASSAHNSLNRDSNDLNSNSGAAPPQRDNSQNATLAKTFTVDTLNIKGALNVCIMTEGVLKAQEVAKIEIPMFNLLDCCFALTDGQYYDRWFPLILSSESIPCEGDVDRYMNNIIPEQSAYSSFDYQPCVRLRVRWIHSDNRHQIEESRVYARFQVPSVSFGLIDSVYAREVMQVAIRGIELRHSVATDYTDSSLNITSLQVDNQLPDPVSAVILCSTRVKHPQPVVRMHVRKKNLLSQNNLTSYETIQLIVQELDLHLEQQTVIASWELVKSLMQERKYGKQQHKQQSQSQSYSHGDNADGGTTNMDMLGFATCTALVQYELLPTLSETFGKGASSKGGASDKKESTLNHDEDVNTLYIEHFEIFPIKVNVSFITTPQVNLAPHQKKQHDTDIRSEGTTGMYSSVSLFLWQVGEVVLDLTSTISDAPIFFHGYEESHVFKTDHEIAKFLQDRYLHYAMWQLYKIVGSLELVGNPIGLLSSLGSGVRDFFYEPAHAIITSPTEFRKIGAGVMKGAVSLVSNTTVGFLGTGITITRSIGRGVAKLSVDSAYMRRREELQRVPATVKAAIKRPFQDFYSGFYYGLVGVVKIPVKTVRRRGAIGVVPGIAKGLLGLGTNPVVGILDSIAHTGDACRDMLNLTIKESAEPVQRLRLSELFGPDGRILPYSFPNALGTQILLVLDRSKEERIKVSNAINSGVGLLHSMFSRTGGDAISMTLGNSANQTSARLSVLNDRRGSSMMRQNSRGEPISTGKPMMNGKNNMVQRKNRFSFHTTNEEEAVLRSDMGMFAHTMSQHGQDDNSVDSEADKDHHKAPVASEYVIYTAIIKQDRNLDLITILTTERIIVTEYHRRPNSAYLKEQWVSPLANVQVPIFERSGGKATLLLRSSSAAVMESASTARKMNADAYSGRTSLSEAQDSAEDTPRSPLGFADASSHSPHSSSVHLQNSKKSANYLLVANYNEEDVIINLHNCILTVRGYFEGLMPTYIPEHNDCEEKEQNVIHIGPWQFARDATDRHNNYGQRINDQMDTKAAETQAIIKELELEVWVHWKKPQQEHVPSFALQLNTKKRDLDAPLWLTAEQEAAVQSHSNIRHIFELCNRLYEEYKRQPRSKYLLKVSIQELYKGGIDYDTFLKNTQPALTAGPSKPAAAADDDSVDSTNTARKSAMKSRFSLFPFVSSSLGIAGMGSTDNSSTHTGGASSNGKRNIISFNLSRGLGGKNEEGKTTEEKETAAPSSPVPGFTAPPNHGADEDPSAFNIVSDISSRFTAGAMTFGAAALALPSTLLASSIARGHSPTPNGTATTKNNSTPVAALVDGEEEKDAHASTRIPFGGSTLNTVFENSESWDTMEISGTPHGDLNNLNNLFLTKEQRQKSKQPGLEPFLPTYAVSDTSSPTSSVSHVSHGEDSSSFTYADLKPNRRHSSPKLGTKNSVRWSTGNITGPHDTSFQELETIEEGPNERPSSKTRASIRRSTGSVPVEDGIASRNILSPNTRTSSARSVTSSFDTDDEALFFDALSPTDAPNDTFDALNESFGPMPSNDIDDFRATGVHTPDDFVLNSEHFRSSSGSPRDSLSPSSPRLHEEPGAGETDEGSNDSTASSQIAFENPMLFSNHVSPGAATLLASNLSGGHTSHPLRRATSFGRPRLSLEGKQQSKTSFNGSERSDESFFSPIARESSVHRRSFGMELVAKAAASTHGPTGYIAPQHTPSSPQRSSPRTHHTPTTASQIQSPEIAAMTERLERLENLLVQALGSKDNTPLQSRTSTIESATRDRTENEHAHKRSSHTPTSAVSVEKPSLSHQLSTSFAHFVAPMLGHTSTASVNSVDTLSRSSSSPSHSADESSQHGALARGHDLLFSASEEENFDSMDYFSPARNAALTASSTGGDPISDADFAAWERSSNTWARTASNQDVFHSEESATSHMSVPLSASIESDTLQAEFLMSSSSDGDDMMLTQRPPIVPDETITLEELPEVSDVQEQSDHRNEANSHHDEESEIGASGKKSSLEARPKLSAMKLAMAESFTGHDFGFAASHLSSPQEAQVDEEQEQQDEPLAVLEEEGPERENSSELLSPVENTDEALQVSPNDDAETPELTANFSSLSGSPHPNHSNGMSRTSTENSAASGDTTSRDEFTPHKPAENGQSTVLESEMTTTNDTIEPTEASSAVHNDVATSPTVAALIDRFSSPLVARSVDRERRRQSRRNDSD